jgi:hypothetical protein
VPRSKPRQCLFSSAILLRGGRYVRFRQIADLAGVLCVGVMSALLFSGCDFSRSGDSDSDTFKFIVFSDVHVRLPGNPDD